MGRDGKPTSTNTSSSSGAKAGDGGTGDPIDNAASGMGPAQRRETAMRLLQQADDMEEEG